VTVIAAAAIAAIAAWMLVAPRAVSRIHAVTLARNSHQQTGGFARLRRVMVSTRGGGRSTSARHIVQVADLLSSLMAAGLDVTTCVTIAAEAVPEPARAALATVARALHLGAPPEAAWQSVMRDASWQPIATAMERSARSGAPLVSVLADTADELRREQVRHLQVAARSAGVRAVGPLAACFLPGYLLLGVVPVVASLAGSALQG